LACYVSNISTTTNHKQFTTSPQFTYSYFANSMQYMHRYTVKSDLLIEFTALKAKDETRALIYNLCRWI